MDINIKMTRLSQRYDRSRYGDQQAPLIEKIMAAANAKAEEIMSTVPESYPAINQESTKQEVIDHLIQVHRMANRHVSGGYGPTVHYTTKATKADLLRLHDRIHDAQSGECELSTTDNALYSVQANREIVWYLGDYPLPAVFHDHVEVTPMADVMGDIDPETLQAAENVREGKKVSGVLNSTERKVLGQVVDNDFGQLKQEMKAFVADSLASKKAEINAEWDAREAKIPDFASQATDLHRQQQQAVQDLRAKHEAEMKALKEKNEDAFKVLTDKAGEKGVTLIKDEGNVVNPATGQREWQTFFKADVTGRKEAIQEAEKESREYLDRALMTLEKQRLTAQRQVLLSGVPEKAMSILEKVPTAKDLMVEAAKDKQQITS